MIVVQALLVGFVVGLVLAALGLPIPAPPSLAGVAAIAGITLAFLFVNYIRA